MEYRVYECVECEMPARTFGVPKECTHCGGRLAARSIPSDVPSMMRSLFDMAALPYDRYIAEGIVEFETFLQRGGHDGNQDKEEDLS